MYIFVTGGFRSGRSNYALRRAAELGPPPWRYVTAGEEEDEAIRGRLERQRRDKEAIWQTGVMSSDIAASIDPASLAGVGAVVLDGFPGWLSARVAAGRAADDGALLAEIERFAERLYRASVPMILVSQEVGMAPLPSDPEQQRLLGLLTSANQVLAGLAGGVVMMVSGVPLKIR